MTGNEIVYMSIFEQADLIKRKEISPVDLVKVYLKRIKKWDKVLHSWITICSEQALAQAKKAEVEIAKGNYRGPLHGIPYGVKDQICTGTIPTTMASKIQKDFGGGINATVVDKMNSAGAILLGKNNMHEFGRGGSVNFHFGEPRNPWNLKYEPSKSSSGSGIATAAGLCSGSLGEDTGGSARAPAWANGIVGIRPTYGRVSRYGSIMYAWTQDTIGPMTRTVADNALLLKTIAGHDSKDLLSSSRPVPDYLKSLTGNLKGIKLGLVREMSVGVPLHPAVEKSLKDALAVLTSLGVTIEEISMPKVKYAVPLQFVTSDVDVASVIVKNWMNDYWTQFDVGTRTRIAAAALIPASVYSRAMRGRVLVRREILDAFKTYDALVTLIHFAPPKSLEESREKIDTIEDVSRRIYNTMRVCTYPFSLANIPAISVPSGFTDDNVPLSIQIAAAPFNEDMVYRVAHAYEQATDWHTRHPDLEKSVGPAVKLVTKGEK